MRRTWIYTLPVTVLIGAGSVVGLLEWQHSRAIATLGVQLASNDTTEATAAVRQLAAMSPPALSPLVEAAASARTEIAMASQEAIGRLLYQWQRNAVQHLRADRAASQVADLAAELARQRHAFGPRDLPWLTTVTADIVQLANRYHGEDTPLIAMHCDEVASVIGSDVRRQRSTRNAEVRPSKYSWRGAADASSSAVSNIAQDDPGGASSESNLEREFADFSAERAMPAAPPLDLGDEPNQSTPSNAADLADPNNSLRKDAANSAATPPNASVSPGDSGSPADPAPPNELASHPDWSMPLLRMVPAQPIGSPARNNAALDEMGPGSPDATNIATESIKTRDLLARWNTTQGTERSEIEKLLTARGLKRLPPELVQRYLSPEHKERQKLVDAIVKTSGIDSRPWLCLLAEDEDAEVRLAAVSLMATSDDAMLVEKAWQVSIHDRDPRIADLATRLRDRRTNAVRR